MKLYRVLLLAFPHGCAASSGRTWNGCSRSRSNWRGGTAPATAENTAMRLLAVFAGLALCLAAAGIYGVTTHLVALRRSEIAVRMSLGARPMILREGAVQAAAGLAVGLSAGVALMSALRSRLYEVSPTDPKTLGVAAAVLFATVVLACLVPARRAMRMDPVSVLKQ